LTRRDASLCPPGARSRAGAARRCRRRTDMPYSSLSRLNTSRKFFWHPQAKPRKVGRQRRTSKGGHR
jgi:hypothetical protein